MATASVRFSAAHRRRQILDVAVELFGRRGFNGTTTREIAQQAGVNEALIFRHFPTKEELYWAVIEEKTREENPGEPLQERFKRLGSDREVVISLAAELLDRRSRDTTLTRLLMFTALENHDLSERFFRTYVTRYFEMLTEYVREGIAAGRFRPLDPLIAARGFLGMVVYHSWTQEIFGWKRYQIFDPRDVSTTLADIWLTGMKVQTHNVTLAAQETSNARARRGKKERVHAGKYK
jgi:AcrR family transcriptional regulator